MGEREGRGDDKADDDGLFAARVPTEADLDRAAAKGWPERLLHRMHDVGYPGWKIELALAADGWPTLEMFDAEVRDRERLAPGLQVREATWEDDERLTDLYAHSNERLGAWDVTVERGPNPFAQPRVQENWHIKLVVDRGVALATSAQSGRSSLVGGRELSVGWMGGWRVRDGFRRRGLSALLLNTPGSAANVFGMLSYWYVRVENRTASSWISHEVLDVQGGGRAIEKLTATVHHLDVASPARRDARVRPAEPDDLARCVELINATHAGLDLFRPYSVTFLSHRLDDLFWGPKPPFVPPVYGWADMAVLEAGGEIVACAGLWDRGANVRERWRHRDTGEERRVDVTCLLDFGHAPGRADALAALIGDRLALSEAMGRTALVAPLEFLPEVRGHLGWAAMSVEVRTLETMAFSSPEVRIDAAITRPYTDLAYW